MIFVDAYEHHNKRAESLEGVLDYFYNELGLFMEVRRSAGDTLMLPFGLGEFATNRNDTKEKADWYSQSFRYLADVARIKIHFLYNAQHGSQDFSLTRLGIQLRSAYQQIRFQFGLLLALSI